jgi:hypothetical protein
MVDLSERIWLIESKRGKVQGLTDGAGCARGLDLPNRIGPNVDVDIDLKAVDAFRAIIHGLEVAEVDIRQSGTRRDAIINTPRYERV